MKILCVVKQVPDSSAPVKVLGDGSGVDPAGLKLAADPFDAFGIALAVELREKGNDVSEIVAVTLGDDKSSEVLRKALAIGADRGIHINDASFESQNEIYYASVIAEAAKVDGGGFDLVLCGKNNTDLDSGAVGPALAEFMGLVHVGAVTGLELSGGGFTARRRIEGAEEVVEGKLPALLTIEKGLVEPRYPSLPNLMKAKKKPVIVLGAGDIQVDEGLKAATHFDSISAPPPRPDCKMIEGEAADMAKELVRLLREEAKVV